MTDPNVLLFVFITLTAQMDAVDGSFQSGDVIDHRPIATVSGLDRCARGAVALADLIQEQAAGGDRSRVSATGSCIVLPPDEAAPIIADFHRQMRDRNKRKEAPADG